MDRIEAGDSVKHIPTGETWYVLGVSHKKNQLCVAGWPPSIAQIDDCVLESKGNGITEEELQARNKIFGINWDETLCIGVDLANGPDRTAYRTPNGLVHVK